MSYFRGIAVLVLSAGANAGIVTLGASKDNTLYESGLGDVSNGVGQHCFVGLTAEPSLRRTVIQFDVEGALPAGASFVGASLTMHMSKTIAGVTPVTLHRALTEWGEGASDAAGEEGVGAPAEQGDATWIYNDYNTYYWSQWGGDFDAAPSAPAAMVGDNGHYTWGPWHGPHEDVAAWLDGSAANHGWVILGDESGGITAKRFDTRENPTEANRPVLRLYYIPACIADWNGDGSVNTNDVLGYLNEWAADAPSADLNASGNVNSLDVVEFLNNWAAGC
jgi:hypothetical protein